MNRMTLLTTTLMGLAVAGTAYADGLRPAPSSAGASIVHRNTTGACTGTLPTLYEQDTATTGLADSGIGVVSQKFLGGGGFNQYNSQAADDFVVPATGWTIQEVDVTGVYFNGSGPAVNETVKFYNNTINNKPAGAPFATFTAAGVDTFGSFCIPINPGLTLAAGRYWVSVIARMNFSLGGEWGWENLVPPKVHKWAYWRNPNGGFGICTVWGKEAIGCISDGQGDHIFTLR